VNALNLFANLSEQFRTVFNLFFCVSGRIVDNKRKVVANRNPLNSAVTINLVLLRCRRWIKSVHNRSTALLYIIKELTRHNCLIFTLNYIQCKPLGILQLYRTSSLLYKFLYFCFVVFVLIQYIHSESLRFPDLCECGANHWNNSAILMRWHYILIRWVECFNIKRNHRRLKRFSGISNIILYGIFHYCLIFS
jgi:hypothetical protein